MRYEALLLAARDAVLRTVEDAPRTPYVDWLQASRGRKPKRGVYIIFDDRGEPCYVGSSDHVRRRLGAHLHLGGQIVEDLLQASGLWLKEEVGHRCACGALINCPLTRVERNGSARRHALPGIRKRVLETYKVVILECPGKSPLPLGLRELERLVQYVLQPRLGTFQDPAGGAVGIREHVARNPPQHDPETA